MIVMVSILFKVLLWLSLLIGFQLQAASKPRVVWLTADAQDLSRFYQQEPYNIATDTEKLLIAALNQYRIVLQVVTLPRVSRLLTSQHSYCVSSRVKTPQRAKQNLFSLPLMLYPGFKLYWIDSRVRPSESLINDKSQLTSLADLFKLQPQRILGLSRGRSHGEYLDQQISEIDPQKLFIRGGEQRLLALFKMLNAGQFDYFIELPTEIKHGVHLITKGQRLKSMAVAGSPAYLLGYIACSKTEENQKFIDDVNRVLTKLYSTESFYQAHARYLDETDLATFNQHFQQVFGQSD